MARNEPGSEQLAYDDLEADLRRRHRRFARYLAVRAVFGLVLLGVGAAAAGLSLAILGVGLGLWHIGWVAPWTTGFGVVLAPFMPAALAFIALRAGWTWWRDRHPEDPDEGCLLA